jgi:tellurite resistance protein TerC
MIAVSIAPWHYGVFVVGVLFILALDLGLFNRKAHKVGFKEALGWSTLWFMVAMAFAYFALPELYTGEKEAAEKRMEFITGYILELSLSMDNVFVIALIFTYFKVKPEFQHRVLFWGIIGALVMRGLMIGVGAAAVAKFHWILFGFGAFLLFTGIKMLFHDDDEGVDPENNPLVKLARKLFPVHDQFEGEHFIVRIDGKRMLTPMAIVLVTIEYTDVIFAVDSIPAIFAVTTDPFIVFTSNMFAILGLRSLYFVLAGMIEIFHYLKYGLALVLAFVGAKMLAEPWLKDLNIPNWGPLVVVISILILSILASLLHKKNASDDSGDAE